MLRSLCFERLEACPSVSAPNISGCKRIATRLISISGSATLGQKAKADSQLAEASGLAHRKTAEGLAGTRTSGP